MAIYPKAQWHGPVPNQGGQMGNIRLGVVHIMAGTLSGSDGWFHNPSAQVSAHFGIGKDGTVFQWVDTANVAWAEANYNGEAISIENEGNSGEQLTLAQAVALSELMVWVYQTHNVPIVRVTDPNASGWIGHGELGVAGGNHPSCPGQPILDQLPAVIKAAWAILFPPAPAPQEDIVHMPTLHKGDKGDFVYTLQGLLNGKCKQGIKVTGVYDDATANGVKNVKSFFHGPNQDPTLVGDWVWKTLFGI